MAREVGEAAAVEAGAEAVVVAEAVTIRWRDMWDLDLDLVTYCAVNWLTIAQARRQTEMHSGRQRAEV